MAVIASHSDQGFGVLDVLAIVIALIGVALQQFADLDLRRFNRTKQPGDVLNTGLWSRSRHPNYLGEMCWWWSLFIFVLAADPGSWWTGIGAVAMTVMFFNELEDGEHSLELEILPNQKGGKGRPGGGKLGGTAFRAIGFSAN